MATKVSPLKFHHLRGLKSQFKYALDNAPVLVFRTQNSRRNTDSRLEIYTDGAKGTKKENRARGVNNIFKHDEDITHPTFWTSHRLQKLCCWNFGSSGWCWQSSLYLHAYIRDIEENSARFRNIFPLTISVTFCSKRAQRSLEQNWSGNDAWNVWTRKNLPHILATWQLLNSRRFGRRQSSHDCFPKQNSTRRCMSPQSRRKELLSQKGQM